MPLYDYRCTACGQEVEVMHGINDTGPSTCQHCGGAMRKALSPPAIHFKGSGWAKKDAAASAKKPAPKAGSTSDKDAKATGSTSTTSDGAKSDPGSTPSSSSEAKG
jgi:putative FmdB family regulatory protein